MILGAERPLSSAPHGHPRRLNKQGSEVANKPRPLQEIRRTSPDGYADTLALKKWDYNALQE